MPRQNEVGSIGSRANDRRNRSPERTSPAREVLNSALSLAAVVGLTLVGSVVLNRLIGRKPA